MDADDNALGPPVGPMNEAEIDREIQAALAVEPSPEFLARVRTRLASEPARTSWSRPWIFAFSGAVAVLVLALVWARLPEKRVDVATAPAAPAPSAPVAQTVPPAPPAVVAPVAQAVRPARAALKRPHREPEVLLDPAETRALRRLVAGTRDGTIDLSPVLQATAPAPMDLPPVSDIAIPLIAIDPLAPSGAEGVRQ